jgi:hypothetical protein
MGCRWHRSDLAAAATASDWQKCGSRRLRFRRAKIGPTLSALRHVRDQVVPAIGAVEPVSVFRNETLNQCVGAQESAHRFMQAVDLVPLKPITRDALIRLV